MPGAPGTTQLRVGQPDSHNGMQGATCYPPWHRTPEAVSMPAEKERARNWEERKQQNNWAQGRPTHGSETSTAATTKCGARRGSHQQTPPPSLYKVPTYCTRAGVAPRAPRGARHGGGKRAVNSQLRTGQSTSYGDVKPSYGGAGGRDRRGCATWAPRSATRQGKEQHRHTERGSHTKRDKGEHSRQGGGPQQGRRGNQNSGNRKPEWSGWWSVRMGGSDNKGDGLASQPCRYHVPGQPLLNRHQVGGVSRSPNGLFAQQEREPIRGRPVRGESIYGGRPGQRVEEQGTWASQKHSEAGYGRPVDRGQPVDSKNSQTTPATTSTSSIRQLLGAADAQTAHYATFSTAPTHQLPGSANAETTPAIAPAAAADRKQRPDATCEGKNG